MAHTSIPSMHEILSYTPSTHTNTIHNHTIKQCIIVINITIYKCRIYKINIVIKLRDISNFRAQGRRANGDGERLQ